MYEGKHPYKKGSPSVSPWLCGEDKGVGSRTGIRREGMRSRQHGFFKSRKTQQLRGQIRQESLQAGRYSHDQTDTFWGEKGGGGEVMSIEVHIRRLGTMAR